MGLGVGIFGVGSDVIRDFFLASQALYRGLILNLLNMSFWKWRSQDLRCNLLNYNYLQSYYRLLKKKGQRFQSYSHRQKFILLCGANL